MNLNRAREFGFTNFLLRLKIPKIHFSLSDISESTNHKNLAEGAKFDCVSELFAKFKYRLSIKIIHCGRGWLLTRDNNKLLSILSPLYILNLVVKDRNELTIFSFVNSDVLK